MLRRLIRLIKRIFWFIPGFLLWASFPPIAEKTDIFFALAPLLWLARNRGTRANVKGWFMSGFFFWFATLAWMPAIVKNGGPWPLVVLGWGALAAYCALYFAAYGYLISSFWGWARNGGWGRRLLGLLVAEPLLWAGLEIIRSRFLGGFAWNQLGVIPVMMGYGAPAALGGVYLLSMVVILINGTFTGIAERLLITIQSKVDFSRFK